MTEGDEIGVFGQNRGRQNFRSPQRFFLRTGQHKDMRDENIRFARQKALFALGNKSLHAIGILFVEHIVVFLYGGFVFVRVIGIFSLVRGIFR